MYNKYYIDNAVSETIGTILLVATTVLIAAIIAAYAMGVVGRTSEDLTVAVTAERLPDNKIVLTYHGGKDADNLNYLVIIGPEPSSRINWTDPILGESKTIDGDEPGKDRILVVGYFWEGDAVVVLDSKL